MAFERRNNDDGFGFTYDDDKKSPKKKTVKQEKPKETKSVQKKK
jgi:hypothetical protein